MAGNEDKRQCFLIRFFKYRQIFPDISILIRRDSRVRKDAVSKHHPPPPAIFPDGPDGVEVVASAEGEAGAGGVNATGNQP
jgi:hypothetical protein